MTTRKWALTTVSCRFLEYISSDVYCQKTLTFPMVLYIHELVISMCELVAVNTKKGIHVHKHLTFLYHNPKKCKLIWVECVPSCSGDLHFQVEIAGAKVTGSERLSPPRGFEVGSPRRFRCSAVAERSERLPARRG
jgi:hypothetical protein